MWCRTPGGAALLTAFALDEAASLEMRREALETLKVWLAPAPLDRVDGYARTFKPQPIAAGLEPKLGALLALKDPTLKTLGIEIMIAHALKAAPELIAAIVGETSAMRRISWNRC